MRVDKGNYILAVNGKVLKTGDNYWKLFNLIPGSKIQFLVNRKPQLEGAWNMSLEPLNQQAQGDLEYERWVDERRASVDQMSNGDIGYLHIRAMDAPSLERFQRDLIDNRGREGSDYR